ncbi:MAG TPA: magnesium transporter CorA family protein [Vicinamibacterales bacterium]|nr:magnesium transporter CorA family protein [Vicinamibacterales bacterium]
MEARKASSKAAASTAPGRTSALHVLVHRDGQTRAVGRVDPRWLAPDAAETLWVDIARPGAAERTLLKDVFQVHEIAIDDALAEVHHPKIETYGPLLYLILHGILATKGGEGFLTRDVDFFLGRNFLITVHHHDSRSVDQLMLVCSRHDDVLAEGPAALLHRIVDQMVDHYRPEVDALEDRIHDLEKAVFERPHSSPLRKVLRLKSDLASLRRVTLPQRDAIGRLARREFPQISEALSYRFRDVHDSLIRIADEAALFQDRVNGLLDAYLSSQSNRLNQVMKVLTVIATIFMPLTVLTSMYGMNVNLPAFPGGPDAQFWWITGLMLVTTGAMLWLFRRMDWL